MLITCDHIFYEFPEGKKGKNPGLGAPAPTPTRLHENPSGLAPPHPKEIFAAFLHLALYTPYGTIQ